MRKNFAEYIINNNINSDNISFTDECREFLIQKLIKQNNYIKYNIEHWMNRLIPEIKKRANESPKFE